MTHSNTNAASKSATACRTSLLDQLLDPGMRLPLILLLCFAVYVPALANGFTMDDRAFAMGQNGDHVNPMVNQLQSLTTYFGSHYYAGITDSSELYRPVTILSFALRHALVGDLAWPAHLANILLHLIAVALCYRLLRRLTLSTGAASLGALVFGLHAVHSEAVVGIVGRAELLGFVFGASATLLFLRMQERPKVPALLMGLASSLLFFLAFCSKESAVCWAPFLLVLLHARRMQRDPDASLLPRPDRRVWMSMLVWLLPLLAFFALRFAALAAVATPDDPTLDYLRNPLYYESGFRRYATAFIVQGHALFQTLFPVTLAADYSHSVFPIVTSPADPWAWLAGLCALVLLAMLVLGLRAHRRLPVLFVAVCGYLGFTFLLSNLLIRTGTIYGERTLYTPVLGLSLVLAWTTDELGRLTRPLSTSPLLPTSLVGPHLHSLFQRRAAQAALGLWLGIGCLVLLQRTPVWKDNATLFLHEARNQPHSARMKTAAAAIHAQRGEHGTARRELALAVLDDPGYAEAWNNLGVAYLNLDKPVEARDALRRGFDARPHAVAHVRHMLQANLALAYLRLRQFPQALDQYQEAQRKHPGYLRSRKDLDEALHALVQDQTVDRQLRERAALLGRTTWTAPSAPR